MKYPHIRRNLDIETTSMDARLEAAGMYCLRPELPCSAWFHNAPDIVGRMTFACRRAVPS